MRLLMLGVYMTDADSNSETNAIAQYLTTGTRAHLQARLPEGLGSKDSVFCK